MLSRPRPWCICFLLCLPAMVLADVPRLIHYQGKLRGAGGAAVDGSVAVRFRLYDHPTAAGSVLFDETHATVTVEGGLFAVFVGSQTPGGVPDSALDASAVYLGIAVNAGAELSPRSAIGSGPHSLKARSAEQLVRPDTFDPVVSVDVAGNVGIGAATPGAKLEVGGQVKITGGVPSVGRVLTSDADGLATWETPESSPWSAVSGGISYDAGNVGIGTNDVTARLRVQNLDESQASFLVQQQVTASPSSLFLRAYGGGNLDECTRAEPTSDGGFIVAGRTSSFGAGQLDFLLVRTDGLGQILWARTFGGGAQDYGHHAIQTSDGGFLMIGDSDNFGGGNICGLLIKTDGNGTLTWARRLGGFGVEGLLRHVRQTSDGGYIVTGYERNLGSPMADGWLVKLDASGNVTWCRTYGGGGEDVCISVEPTSDGGYILGAGGVSFGAGGRDDWIIKVEDDGDLQWARTIGGGGEELSGVTIPTADGGYLVSVSTNSYGAGDWDAMLVKFDSAGSLMWAKTLGGSAAEHARGLALVGGDYLFSGFTASFGAGNDDWFLSRFDGSGNRLWTRTYGGVGADSNETSLYILPLPGGDIAMGGTFASFGAGNFDAGLIRTDASGDIAGCAAVQAVTPSVTSPSITITSPSISVGSHSPPNGSVSVSVSSPTPATDTECSVIVPGGSSVQDALVVAADGAVGLGVTSPSHPLDLASGAHVTSGGVWTNASSRSLKHDIADLPLDRALDALSQMNPVTFRYNAEPDQTHVGFIAEDAPELLATKDRSSLSPMDVVAVLTRVVKDQERRLQEQQCRMEEQETLIQQLRSERPAPSPP